MPVQSTQKERDTHENNFSLKPKRKFISHLLCGIIFSGDLILTHIASKVLHPGRLTAIAKRFRRHLADGISFLKPLWFNYLCLVRRKLDVDGLFILPRAEELLVLPTGYCVA